MESVFKTHSCLNTLCWPTRLLFLRSPKNIMRQACHTHESTIVDKSRFSKILYKILGVIGILMVGWYPMVFLIPLRTDFTKKLSTGDCSSKLLWSSDIMFRYCETLVYLILLDNRAAYRATICGWAGTNGTCRAWQKAEYERRWVLYVACVDSAYVDLSSSSTWDWSDSLSKPAVANTVLMFMAIT